MLYERTSPPLNQGAAPQSNRTQVTKSPRMNGDTTRPQGAARQGAQFFAGARRFFSPFVFLLLRLLAHSGRRRACHPVWGGAPVTIRGRWKIGWEGTASPLKAKPRGSMEPSVWVPCHETDRRNPVTGRRGSGCPPLHALALAQNDRSPIRQLAVVRGSQYPALPSPERPSPPLC
jgi:hypothetical protein